MKTYLRTLSYILCIVLLYSCEDSASDTLLDTIFSGIDEENNSFLKKRLRHLGGDDGMEYFILPDSYDYANIPQDPQNPITNEKVVLGEMLFHETGLGQNPIKEVGRATYSCSSCHNANGAYLANVKQGIGEGGIGIGLVGESRVPDTLYDRDSLDVQPIRPPTNLNVAFQEAVLWNGSLGGVGVNEQFLKKDILKAKNNNKSSFFNHLEANNERFHGVETQAMEGQDLHRLLINEEVVTRLGYKEYFDRAFPDVPEEERYSKKTGAFAIAAYERTLLTNEAPWQRWLKGEKEALTGTELQGAVLFFDKGKCYNCHTGPALNTMAFHAVGFDDFNATEHVIQEDDEPERTFLGRGGFTQDPDEYYQFKVPQLYNLKHTPFLGHGSSFQSIEEVVRYFNEAHSQNPNVSEEYLDTLFQPLNLSEVEIIALTRFIQNGLYDPKVNRYMPKVLPSLNCFPNSDNQSMIDLDCELPDAGI